MRLLTCPSWPGGRPHTATALLRSVDACPALLSPGDSSPASSRIVLPRRGLLGRAPPEPACPVSSLGPWTSRRALGHRLYCPGEGLTDTG